MDKWCRLLSCTRQFVSYSPRINAAFFQFRVRTRFIRRRMFIRGRFFILVHNVKLFFFLITKEYVKLWSKSYEVNLQDHCSTSSPTCLPRERKRSQRARVQLPLCTGNSCLGLKQPLYESLLAIIGLVKSMFGSCWNLTVERYTAKHVIDRWHAFIFSN